MIKTERVYSAFRSRGFGVLVDRLWPRGLGKDKARIDLWLKEISPSDELRKWFGHDPDRWNEFRKRYFSELDGKKELVQIIMNKAEEDDVILLYGAKDEQHNNAVALKQYIESMLGSKM